MSPPPIYNEKGKKNARKSTGGGALAGRPLGRLRQSQSVKAACALGMAAGGPTAAGGAGALADSGGGSRPLRCGRLAATGAAFNMPMPGFMSFDGGGHFLAVHDRCGVGGWRATGRRRGSHPHTDDFLV